MTSPTPSEEKKPRKPLRRDERVAIWKPPAGIVEGKIALLPGHLGGIAPGSAASRFTMIQINVDKEDGGGVEVVPPEQVFRLSESDLMVEAMDKYIRQVTEIRNYVADAGL